MDSAFENRDWEAVVSRSTTKLFPTPGECKLCLRHSDHSTSHHLIPQSVCLEGQDNRTVKICRLCHDVVHGVMSNEEMAASYNTLELLRTHPGVISWLRWNLELTDEQLKAKMQPRHHIPEPVPGAKSYGPALPSRKASQRREIFDPLLPAIEQALEKIWSERAEGVDFPRFGFAARDEDDPDGNWKLNRRSRGYALRKQIRRIIGTEAVQKPEMRQVMLSRSEWIPWVQWLWATPPAVKPNPAQ